MQTMQSSGPKSGSPKQVEMLYVLKEQLDLVYRQMNNFRAACKTVDQLNRTVRGMVLHEDHGQNCVDGQLLAELVKFEQNYRVQKRKLCKLERKMLNVNLYDNLYDLYESLVIEECDRKDAVNLDENCNEPRIEDTAVNDSAATSIDSDSDTIIDQEFDITEVTYLNSNELETSNYFCSNTSFSLSSQSSTLVDDISVVNRESQKTSISNFSISRGAKKKKQKILHFETSSNEMIACSSEDFQYSSSDLVDLNQHSTIHLESNQLFKCSKKGCDFSTKHSQYLEDHLSVHGVGQLLQCVPTGKPKFQCGQCNKTYVRQYSLSAHMRIHEREPKYKCRWEECDFRSHRFVDFKIHQSVHTGGRQFKCDQCDKAFTKSLGLSLHKRTHESEPRFRCSWKGCQYSTHLNKHLKAHQCVHTGERPFQCGQCDKSYKFLSNLGAHKRIHKHRQT